MNNSKIENTRSPFIDADGKATDVFQLYSSIGNRKVEDVAKKFWLHRDGTLVEKTFWGRVVRWIFKQDKTNELKGFISDWQQPGSLDPIKLAQRQRAAQIVVAICTHILTKKGLSPERKASLETVQSTFLKANKSILEAVNSTRPKSLLRNEFTGAK